MTLDNLRSWWWAPDEPDPHVPLVNYLHAQFERQQPRYTQFRRYYSVYEHGWLAAQGLRASSDAVTTAENDTVVHTNWAQQAVDTISALVCSPKIAPFASTKGGAPEQQRRAEQLSNIIEGTLSENEWEAIKEEGVLDALVCGLGAWHVGHDGERVVIERVLPFDLLIDDSDTRYRSPRCMYRRMYLDRHVVLAEYGEASQELAGSKASRRTAILAAPVARPLESTVGSTGDRIEVFEAWHLRSSRKAKDGRHVIAVNGATLVDEAFNRDTFPIVVYVPRRPAMGIWGIPVMRQLAALQLESEQLGEKFQLSVKRMGGAHMLVQNDSLVSVEQLTNDVGTIIRYGGQIPPKEWTPNAMGDQIVAYRESLPSTMLRVIGTSDFAARSEVPAGLSQASGVALRTFEDAESKRLVHFHRELERAVERVANEVIHAARDLVEYGDPAPVRRAAGGKTEGFASLDWKACLIDASDFVLRVSPISALPQSLSAKYALLQELFNQKLIDREAFMSQLGIADLESETSLQTADQRLLDRTIADMVIDGEYRSPEPTDNLALILSRGALHISRLRDNGVDDERVDLVRQYLDDARRMIEAATPPAPAGPPPGPMPPPGAPSPDAAPQLPPTV